MLLRKSTFATALLTALCVAPSLTQAALYITIVQGLGGQPIYDNEFSESRQKIETASHSITDADKVISFSGDKATRAALLKHFTELAKKMTTTDRAAIYLIGHGTYDGDTYKFNIPGPDLTAQDVKGVLDKLPGRNHLLVNSSSTSGAMVDTLVGRGDKAASPNFVVISATRNGNERNATQFGHFFADALGSREADLNKNNSVSIQEAYDFTEKRVSEFFQEQGKLATEHAQLRGEGASQINLARLNAAEQKAELATADDKLADMLKRRQQLDTDLEELQLRRSQMKDADYLAKFQQLVLQSAELNEQIDAAQKVKDANAAPPVLPPPPELKRVP